MCALSPSGWKLVEVRLIAVISPFKLELVRCERILLLSIQLSDQFHCIKRLPSTHICMCNQNDKQNDEQRITIFLIQFLEAGAKNDIISFAVGMTGNFQNRVIFQNCTF